MAETIVLRNVGFDVAAPILYDPHAWLGPFKPYAHQRAGAAFMTMNQRAFVLLPMGAGKSATTVYALRWLKRQGLIRVALIVAPLSTLRDVWQREINRIAPELRVAVLHAPHRRDRLALLGQDFDVFIINPDGIKLLEKELSRRHGLDAIVIDESTAFKNARTDRWKAMNTIINRSEPRRFVWALTGTPAAQDPTDAWGQARLVKPDNVPRAFTLFRDLTMVPDGQYKWKPRPEAREYVMKALEPYILVPKEECFDLPPITYVTRHCELTKEQKKLADAIRKEWMAELDRGATITPQNAAVRMSKLLQIYQGAVIDDIGDATPVAADGRMALLLELVQSTDRGVLVFVPFKAVLANVAAKLKQEKVECAVVHGGVSQKERVKRFEAFRNGEVKVLVAHPKTTSHGLSFVNADTTIWFGPYMSAEGYMQANQRMARPGQQHKMSIYHISASPLEDMIYGKLKNKLGLQDEILELMKKVAEGELT